MSATVEAEVIPPGSDPVRGNTRHNVGFLGRPGVSFFVTGVLTGMILAGIAVYVVKKKL